ncbi:phage head closure protein [Lacticaseibacillus casei]|jgi:SPP1 family predicted phage head-tail adaptor|uniref:phage head closure protein n=1 Tax=Lacticaseibacillus casei TaxID=1582 RepID=UPI001C3879EA|nr:phage head closure protein [Lacticaseibacillus casei]QXG58275.1 phage head closure protein [Lacticaseibacillus casei]
MKNYAIARLNKVAEIGKTVSHKTGAGINIPVFEATGTLFYGSYNRTVTQTYQITGTAIEDTIAIVVRHSDVLDKTVLVKLNGTVYQIQSIAYDDDPNAFDVVTLKKTAKGA